MPPTASAAEKTIPIIVSVAALSVVRAPTHQRTEEQQRYGTEDRIDL